jgi:hypothetical protein
VIVIHGANPTNCELLGDLRAFLVKLFTVVEGQSFFASVWIRNIHPIEGSPIAMVTDLRRDGARAAVINKVIVQLSLFLDAPSSEMNERVKRVFEKFTSVLKER